MNIALLQALGGLGGGGGIPFKTDLVQHLFKSGATDFITEDGLYARDYSGNNNHALLKNSYMCSTLPGSIAVLVLPTAITLLNTDNIDIELYFQMDSTVGSGTRFNFFGNRIADTELAAIRFHQASGVFLFDNAGNTISFAQVWDFKTLRKFRFNINAGYCDYYVNDVLIEHKAWPTFAGYTAHNFIGSYTQASSMLGKYCGIKITRNGIIEHFWPCSSGTRKIWDVITGELLSSANLYNDTPALQNVFHYNIRYGCDMWSNHADLYEFIPKMLNGDTITPDTTEAGTYWNWEKMIDKNPNFPVCETTIQTLKGDINYFTNRHNVSDVLFTNIVTDKVQKDILVYNTAKTTEEIATINAFTKYNTFSDFTYNLETLALIRASIEAGNARYITIGDSLSPFTHRFHSYLDYYCSIKGCGYGVFSTGNFQENLYEDVFVFPSGNYEYLISGVTQDTFGINGHATWYKPGNTVTFQPRYHKYTNIKIFYAKNTDKGSFDIVTGGVTTPVNCNAAQGLGVVSIDVAENSNNIVCNNFVGTVYLYGIEINSGTSANHLLSMGGYTTLSFTTAPNYIAEFAGAHTLDFAFVMLGANDAQGARTKSDYKTRMTTIIGKLKQGDANRPIILLTPTTKGLLEGQLGEDLVYWEYVRQYADACKELSDSLINVCMIDTGLIYPRYDDAFTRGWMVDNIHQTPDAQEWLARQLYKCVINVK